MSCTLMLLQYIVLETNLVDLSLTLLILFCVQNIQMQVVTELFSLFPDLEKMSKLNHLQVKQVSKNIFLHTLYRPALTNN